MARAQLVTQKAYAAKKKVSPQYINKLVSQGKIRKVGSKIDVRQADAAIKAWVRTGRVVAKKPARRKAAPRVSSSASERAGGSRPESATANLTQSRAKRERFLANIAELDYKKLTKELLPAAEVLEAERRKNATIRASFRRLARWMAPILHRATSPAELECALLREIDLILDQLARDPLGMETAPAEVEPAEEIPSPVEPAIAMPIELDQVVEQVAAVEAAL